VFFAAAYAAADTRPIARLFNEMVRSRYGIHAPDHDFNPFIGPLLTRSFVRRICSACRLVSVSLMLERWSGCVGL